LGGRHYIGNPKQPTSLVYTSVDDEYQISQFRGNEIIQSGLFPELRLTTASIDHQSWMNENPKVSVIA